MLYSFFKDYNHPAIELILIIIHSLAMFLIQEALYPMKFKCPSWIKDYIENAWMPEWN